MSEYGCFDLSYVRTDRNGTKYYQDVNCPRCCGYGFLDKWAHTGRVCFACGGTGLRPRPKIVKVYTPEHEAKLEARRAAKAAKSSIYEDEEARARKAQEVRAREWMYQGFSREGFGFIHYGDTYHNRDVIRSAGGRWNWSLNAYVAPQRVELSGVQIMEVSAAELCTPGGIIDSDKAWELSKAWRS